jgi:acid stress chaperone HdeB
VTKALVEWVQAWPSAFGIFRQGPSRVWTMRAIAGKIPQAEGDGFMKFPVVAFGVFVAGLLATGTPAFSGAIDLSTWTCEKFQGADKDDIGVILAWLDGYYRDENDPPVIDTEKFVANAKKLGQYCAKHPEIGIITAADELFSK